MRARRLFLLMALVLPQGAFTTSHAGSVDEVLHVKTGVTEASVSMDYLLGEDGSLVFAAVVALRTEDDATLSIHLCDESSCRDYAVALQPEEFVLDPITFVADIRTTVDGLGSVRLRNYPTGLDPAAMQLCPDHRTRSAVLLAGLGARVKHAGDAFGGQIGSWTVRSGSCGMTARDVNAVWASL